jgi:CRISPR system Cascade subunit CasB
MSNRRKHGLSEGAMGAFLSWWTRINSESVSGSARADRAMLRRAATLTAVAMTPGYQRLYAEMEAAHDGEPWRDYERDRIAALVGLAAHVKAANALSLPEAMSKPGEGSDRNPVSELRFSRLLDAPDIDSLFIGLRRALPLIGHGVDPAALANDVFGWGDVVKKRWAYTYAWPKKSA